MRFEKVSREQYVRDMLKDTYYLGSLTYTAEDLLAGHVRIPDRYIALDISSGCSPQDIYQDIKLPKRATKKSAGYDFYAPYDFILAPGETIKIATGIRVILDDDKFLMCAPRSGHGFKARIQLDNTIGIIDADYSDSKNEGHIMIKLTNDSHTGERISVKKGEGMIQAIILQYYTVEDDHSEGLRDGGFGSTTK